MNNLQSAMASMKAMRTAMEKSAAEINALLDKLGLSGIDIEPSLKMVDKQISSAEKRFTVSIIGTFKSGKSTIINSLLELKGNARLSSETDPDTAKAVRLIYRENGHCEAEVDFGGRYPTEETTWEQAKKYTSHITMERESEAFRKRAEAVEEVRYYIEHPFLKQCDIIDLPGTGTKSEDTIVTDEKILETDCYLWVVSTVSEPDNETIANLEKLRHKVIPIINVWQKQSEGIEGSLTPEEMRDILVEQYSAYISSEASLVTYYAGEVDDAQREGRELDPTWGKEALATKLLEIVGAATSTDRARRIETNLLKAISDCEKELRDCRESPQMERLASSVKREKTDAGRVALRLSQCKKAVNNNIRSQARKTTDELVDIITAATESFIETKMYSLDLSAIARKRYAEKLEREFREQLDLEGEWVHSLAQGFSDDLRALLEGKYAEFALELDEVQTASKEVSLSESPFSVFINSLSGAMLNQIIDKLLPILIKLIGQIALAFIPVLNIADVLYAVFSSLTSASSFTKNDKLHEQAQIVIRSARIKIKQQSYTIKQEFEKKGIEIGEEYYRIVKEEVDKQGLAADEKMQLMRSFESAADGFTEALKEQSDTARGLFAGE